MTETVPRHQTEIDLFGRGGLLTRTLCLPAAQTERRCTHSTTSTSDSVEDVRRADA